MGINAYYDDVNSELEIRPRLTMEQARDINDKLDHDRFPWQVAHDAITTPEEGFRVHYFENETDANTLAVVIDHILKVNPDCKVNGEVFVTWDCDDECKRIQVVDNRVYCSFREYTFTEPKQVNEWV